MSWITQFLMKSRTLLFIVFCFLHLIAFSQERKPVPDYVGLVNDFANVLSPSEKQDLELFLRAYEDSTSTQIAVVTENSLNGRSEFDRAMDFARQWGIGQKGKNNGVLIYMSIQDRKLFFLPADKTQGVLTNGVTGEIRRNYMNPFFAKQQYYLGLKEGITQIMLQLEGEFQNEPISSSQSVLPFVIMLIIIFVIIYLISKNGGGKGRGMYRGGTYWFPTTGGWSGGGSSGGSSWGGFGGGGGFNGGGSGGSW